MGGWTIKRNSVLYSLILLLLFFHNCGKGPEIGFTGSEKKVSHSSTQATDTGEGFFGKPAEGDYVRTFPNYKCQSKDHGVQGMLVVDNDSVDIKDDSCEEKDITFTFSDRILSFSSYNRDYLGVGTAIYEYLENPKLHSEPPVTEVFCQWSDNQYAADVVVKVDNTLTISKAKIYLGDRQLDGSWRSRVVPLFSVSRNDANNILTYQTSGFNLQINKPAAPSLFGTAVLSAIIDEQAFTYSLSCRVANQASIEEMNTTLSDLVNINTFTTDQQEALCANPAANFCENFENRTPGAVGSSQAAKYMAPFGVQFTTTSMLFGGLQTTDGVRGLEVQWPAGSRHGSGLMGFQAARQVQQYYQRVYVKFSPNYKFSAVADLMFMDFDFSAISFQGPTNSIITKVNGVDRTHSLGQPLGCDQWHCLEWGVKIPNTLTENTGSYEVWFNNRKIVDMQNINFSSASRNYANNFQYWFEWHCVGASINGGDCVDAANPDNQHPAQSVFIDNIAVADQRVGCF